jgi:hypothetical protein
VAAESGHGAIPVLFMFGAPVGAHGPLPWRPAHVIASSTESEGQQPSSICQQKAVHSIPVCKLHENKCGLDDYVFAFKDYLCFI